MNVNRRLDTGFVLTTDEEKSQFLELCKYIGTMMSLGQIFKQQSSIAYVLCHLKHILYLVYLVGYPMRAKFPLTLVFLAAHLCSILQRYLAAKTTENFLHLMLADEEFMHVIWLLTYLLLGW